MNSDLENSINALPDQPGCYLYHNTRNEIIYVGKAKNLKKRVSSYFNKQQQSRKTSVLVRNIHSIEYIVVTSEHDALLLENNLIKKHQPRYNVLLKDGKTYPSICITHEPFPRIFKTRNIIKNGSEYFGPYSSNYTLDLILEIIHNLYPIRTCKQFLDLRKIEQHKYKLCLQYHIHKCNGMCEGMESVEEYKRYIDHVREIIRGNAHEISKILYKEMQDLAAEYKFEEAQKIKEKYELIEKFRSKSVIANTNIKDTDVFGYDETENNVYVTMLKINNGAIVQGKTIEYRKHLDETKEYLLALGIMELREQLGSMSRNLIVPFVPENVEERWEVYVPQRGDGKKILDLALQNVKQYKLDKLKQAEKLNPEQRMTRILGGLQRLLQLEKMPLHIECFDNSNISGTNAVAACVVFRNAKPAKKEYRLFNIKTVEGPDDYASMREVIDRRYSRMIAEAAPLPDLIIADGGIGQMEAIRQITEDKLGLQIPIAGLSKNDKHKTNEILFGFPPQAIGLKPTDELFKFLALIQEEVHRTAIDFHKKKRSKAQVASELDNIAGIGEKTKTELIKHFKSLKRIRMASVEELSNVVGSSRASILYRYFNTESKA